MAELSRARVSGLFVFLVWCLLRSFFNTPLYSSLFEFLKLMSYAMFFSLLSISSAKVQLKFFGWLVICLGALETGRLVFNFGRLGNMGGFLQGNPGYSALLIGAGLLFSSAYFASLEDWDKKKWMALAAIPLLLAGLFLTRSRSGILGTFVGLSFILPKQRRSQFLLIFMLCAAAAVHARVDFLKIDPENASHSFGRLLIWKTALMSLGKHWLVGYGLGNFEAAYRLFAQPADAILKYELTTSFAHNDLLQIAVETGILGLSFFLYGLWRMTRPSLFPNDSSWEKKGALGVFFLFLIFSMFNFSYFLPLTGLLLSGSCALLFSAGGSEPPELPRSLKWTGGFFLAACCLFAGLSGLSDFFVDRGNLKKAAWLMPLRADIGVQRAQVETQGEEAARLLEKSLFWDSRDPFVWSRLARTLLRVPGTSLEKIQRDFNEAEELSPKHAPFWLDDGFFHLQLKDLAGAKILFKKAVHLEPNSALPYFGLGMAFYAEHDNEKAAAFLRKAIELKDRNYPLVSRTPYAEFLFSIDSARTKLLISKIEKSPLL